MVGAFQTYPITISRLQVIFIAIRIQVIFTSNKCIDDASLALQWRRLWHWGWSVLWQNPCCPARARWLCYLLWHRVLYTVYHTHGLNTVTLWWPNGSVAKAEPVTKCHSVWTPRHTCVTHNVTQCWDSKTHLSHIPTHMVTNIGRPPTQLVSWDWYIRLVFFRNIGLSPSCNILHIFVWRERMDKIEKDWDNEKKERAKSPK